MPREHATKRPTHLRRAGALAAAAFAGIVAYVAMESLSQMTSLAQSFGVLNRATNAAPSPTLSREGAVEIARHAYDTNDALEALDHSQPEPVLAAGIASDETATAPAARVHPELRTYQTAEIAEENLPAGPAPRGFTGDSASFRTRLETLLESDPETLRQVGALLEEPDAIVRAQNLQLLRETFGVE